MNASPSLRPGFSPEFELLVRCARTSTNTATDAEIRALARPDLDWKALTRLAHEHQVTSLAYRCLTQICPEQVPNHILERWRFRYQANAAHYLQLCHHLAQVLELLQSHGIEALTLKGPALAAQAYAEPSVREFKDLDLLVRREDALRSRDLLETAGYASYPPLTRPQLRVFLRSECEFWFSTPDNQVPLELHWNLREPVYAYPLASHHCWSNAIRCEIAGRRVWVLSAEDTLLMLACHGAKHRWGQLKLTCDIAELLRSQPDLDWDTLADRAKGLNGLRMLLLAFQLAHQLLAAPLPDPIRRRCVRDGSLSQLTDDVIAYLVDSQRPSRQSVTGTCLYLRMRERWQDRLRYCSGTLLTPTLEDWNSVTLPEPLFPLYYLVRPLRLLARHFRRPGRAASAHANDLSLH